MSLFPGKYKFRTLPNVIVDFTDFPLGTVSKESTSSWYAVGSTRKDWNPDPYKWEYVGPIGISYENGQNGDEEDDL